jgi:2-iminobutanoate/2-iminopropanoate deaminase
MPEIEIVSTQHAPAAIGPYSQAVAFGDLVLCSGQIALDPGTGEIVAGDVRAQTEQVMKNLAGVLAQAGSGFDRVLRTTVFVADMNDFVTVNEVYGRHFSSEAPPARATVEVARLPKDALVEIDCIAVRSSS